MRILKVSEAVSIKRSVDAGTEEQRQTVKAIIEDVRKNGDTALFSYTEKFDRATLTSMQVSEEEIREAYEETGAEYVAIIKEAAENIRSFHEKQVRNSWLTTEANGTILGQKVTPLDSVGVYVPGGTAAYPSSVLMNVMPAKVAGVERIVMVSPPGANGKLPAAVVVAAQEAGVKEIFKVGEHKQLPLLLMEQKRFSLLIKSSDQVTSMWP